MDNQRMHETRKALKRRHQVHNAVELAMGLLLLIGFVKVVALAFNLGAGL